MKYIFLIFLMGCSHREAVLRNDDISEYVNRFETHGKKYYGDQSTVGNISYYFENMGFSEIAGYCQVDDNEKKIVINSVSWSKYTDLEKEELLFHELGHCVLYRGHLNEVFPDDTPVSIMYYRVMNEDVYKEKYDYYIKELFTGER